MSSTPKLISKLHPDELLRFYSSIKVNLRTKCWEWQGYIANDGYGMFTRDHSNYKVHRISYEIHFGKIPDKLLVLHDCDNKICASPYHLRTGTDMDNAIDRDRKGRHQNHVSDENVIKIYNDCLTGKFKQYEIADRYGICGETVKRIQNISRPRYKRLLEHVALSGTDEKT